MKMRWPDMAPKFAASAPSWATGGIKEPGLYGDKGECEFEALRAKGEPTPPAKQADQYVKMLSAGVPAVVVAALLIQDCRARGEKIGSVEPLALVEMEIYRAGFEPDVIYLGCPVVEFDELALELSRTGQVERLRSLALGLYELSRATSETKIFSPHVVLFIDSVRELLFTDRGSEIWLRRIMGRDAR